MAVVRLWVCVSFFFFFSSRRRHTRYWRDWSSDVCSSDLSCRLPRDGLRRSLRFARNDVERAVIGPAPYRAPFRVHEVEQVVTLPWSHLMQTATHWSMTFGLYWVYRLVAQLLVDPVTSGSDQQPDRVNATMMRTATLCTGALLRCSTAGNLDRLG